MYTFNNNMQIISIIFCVNFLRCIKIFYVMAPGLLIISSTDIAWWEKVSFGKHGFKMEGRGVFTRLQFKTEDIIGIILGGCFGVSD